jgi:hypothetical protein
VSSKIGGGLLNLYMGKKMRETVPTLIEDPIIFSDAKEKAEV